MAADFYQLSYKHVWMQWDATHQFAQNVILFVQCSVDLFLFHASQYN